MLEFLLELGIRHLTIIAWVVSIQWTTCNPFSVYLCGANFHFPLTLPFLGRLPLPHDMPIGLYDSADVSLRGGTTL